MPEVIYDAEELQYDSDTGRYYFMRGNRMYYPAIQPLPTVPVVTDSEDESSDDMEYDWFAPQQPVTPERLPRLMTPPGAPVRNADNIIPRYENLSVARRLF